MKPQELSAFYRDQLDTQILPFWLKHAPDEECGGYFTCLDRTGAVYDADKVDMLMQGRIAWTFAWLFNEYKADPHWIDFARRGVNFVRKHGFHPSGRMYYGLKRDGRPLYPPSLYHVEFSNLIAMAEISRATGDKSLYQQARAIFDQAWLSLQDPTGDWIEQLPESGPMRNHGYSMITMNVLQQLRTCHEEPTDTERINQCIEIMRRYHLRPERRLLLEFTGWNGEDWEGSLGRRVNPGHMIEGGIFLIHESKVQANAEIRQMGLDLIRWGFEAGWDQKYGGVFNDVDAEGRPILGTPSLIADCKLWWQHAEALYGLLLGFKETGDPWFWTAYEKTHQYSFDHFADPEHGEWFGYLDRTGRRIHDAKGSNRKCCYHIGRNFLWCAKIADLFAPTTTA